jgi:hypothetical protein
MSLIVVGLVLVIPVVGAIVILAINDVEHRLRMATTLLEELTRLRDINEQLARLESDVSRIRRAVGVSHAGYTDADYGTVKHTLGGSEKDGRLSDRAMGMDVDSRALDEFESEQ